MISKTKLTGAVLAMGAASVFALAPVVTTSAAMNHQVHCHGVNACKGKNSCKTKANDCKGHGSCKGQGFVKMSKEACDDIGGKVE